MHKISNSALVEAVEIAMRQMVSAVHHSEGAYIKTALLYPSGSGVVIRVSGSAERFFVTDFGSGYMECDMAGYGDIYKRQARKISEMYGVKFDGDAFFSIEVPKDKIAGAVSVIASCSCEAVILASDKAAEKTANDTKDVLIERLNRTFGASKIIRSDHVFGASNHKWEFTASTIINDKKTLFEVASAHPNSVGAAAMKMHDVARLDNPPNRVIFVPKKESLGTYLGVLSHSASVIEKTITEQQLIKLAA